MVLNTGRYRNYCAVKSPTTASDGQGGRTSTWAELFSEWFRVTPLSQSRTLDEGGIKYRMAATFECRYRNDYPLSGEYQITWNSQDWTVASAIPDETLSYINILAYVRST